MSGPFIGYPTGWILGINRFGAWSTEEVLPWRGPMPDIPHLMRR